MKTADNWADLSTYACKTCRFYVPKKKIHTGGKEDVAQVFNIGRCRRHAPTMNGYPVVYPTDWCGDHKMGETPK